MTYPPGSPEWKVRVAAIKAQEALQIEQWWWLSFGLPGKGNWRGGCCVKARGLTLAIEEAIRLGINPGGECKGEPFGQEVPDDVPVNRLLKIGRAHV